MSTLTEPGPFDALEKADPSEPLFTLLARDPDAPATITEWTRLRRNRAIKLYGDSKRASDKKLLEAELAQCAHAERIAEEMSDWRDHRDGRETPEAQRLSHGVQRGEEELADAKARDKQDRYVRHLREAAYHLSEAKDGLIAEQLVREITGSDMVQMLARINGIADALTPVRGMVEPALALPEPEGQVA